MTKENPNKYWKSKKPAKTMKKETVEIKINDIQRLIDVVKNLEEKEIEAFKEVLLKMLMDLKK